jgi:hypothetical protein
MSFGQVATRFGPSSPLLTQSGSGGGLAGLLADAITAAIDKAAPNYMPLARQANSQAINLKGTGLPAGPYDGLFGKDMSDY